MFKALGRLLVVLLFGWAGSASAGPITDTVIVGSREWAQPDDFTSLSWDSIYSVCGAGPCSGDLTSGSNTYTMDGWTWASIYDVQSLFNVFTLRSEVAPSYYEEVGSTWAPDFLNMFNATSASVYSKEVAGFTASSYEWDDEYGRLALVLDHIDSANHYEDVITTDAASRRYEHNGGWFFRDASPAPAPAPAAATVALFGLGLASLVITRRKRGAKV